VGRRETLCLGSALVQPAKCERQSSISPISLGNSNNLSVSSLCDMSKRVQPFLARELLEGSASSFDLTSTMRDVLSALTRYHSEEKVIHGDVCPNNIMILRFAPSTSKGKGKPAKGILIDLDLSMDFRREDLQRHKKLFRAMELGKTWVNESDDEEMVTILDVD